MKKCPLCLEEILDDAVKCKYCKEWIENEVTATNLNTKSWYRLLKIAYVLLGIIWLSIGYFSTEGNYDKFLPPAIISVLIMVVFYWVLKNIIHYVVFGKMTSKKIPTKNHTQKINQDSVVEKGENKKKWGVGSYFMLVSFLVIYLSQLKNLKEDWAILVEGALAGIIASLLFYPIFNRSKIKNEQIRALATGVFLFVAVGTIIKLLMIIMTLLPIV